jgi:AraC-like DNA-binding protein
MEHTTLSNLIDMLERGTKMHICVAFLANCGNQKTRCTESQTIHDRPVCMAAKKLPQGLDSCYRCRMRVQKAIIRRRKPIAGLCINGVYEYCRPIIYEDRVICVVYIGNILMRDPAQRRKLERRVGSDLLETMEQAFSPEDCVRIADILESYILFLFSHYGIENKTFDPLVENIKNYVRENLAYDFTMEELAGAFNYTPKYVGRVFKSRTGQTVKEYCNQMKITQAKRLLVETDLPIENVALQVGFNSLTYFDRVFHKLNGISPQVYRSAVK